MYTEPPWTCPKLGTGVGVADTITCDKYFSVCIVVQYHDPTFSRNLAWSINNHFYAFFNSF